MTLANIEDDENLRRGLKWKQPELPEDLEEICTDILRFSHNVGLPGPINPQILGAVAAILRYVAPASRITGDIKVSDWAKMPVGTKLQYRIAGEWSREAGSYQGGVGAGTVALKLSSGRVDEFSRIDVRPWSGEHNAVGLNQEMLEEGNKEAKAFNAPDKRAELVDKPDPVPEKRQESTARQHMPISTRDDDPFDEPPPTDWSNVEPGSPVWCNMDDGTEILEGTLVAAFKNGRAKINVAGKEQAVPLKSLVLSG